MARQPVQIHVYLYREKDGRNEYAIFQRADDTFCWQGISGGLEDGETEEQAARRELFEETGLTTAPDAGKRAVTEYPLSPFGRKQLVIFTGKAEGSLKLRAGENRASVWVTAEKLKTYLYPNTAAACERLI